MGHQVETNQRKGVAKKNPFEGGFTENGSEGRRLNNFSY